MNVKVVTFGDREKGEGIDPIFAAAVGAAGRWKHFMGNSPDGCYYSWDCPGAEMLQVGR